MLLGGGPLGGEKEGGWGGGGLTISCISLGLQPEPKARAPRTQGVRHPTLLD
jgi:hypothetical protein